MPIDDRLRRGLEVNALSLVPEAEARLAAAHRRGQRARATVIAATSAAVAAVVAVLVLAVALSGGDLGARGGEPAAPAESSASRSTAPTSATIPDSSWRRVISRSQAVAAGADLAWLRDNFDDVERLPLTLAFVGGVYSQSGRYPGGWAVGDAGTFDIDETGLLVLTSTAPGCRGCKAALEWRVSGDRLHLAFSPASAATPIDRLMFEGNWKRQQS